MGNLCQHIRTKRSLSQSENITQTDNSIRTSYNPKNDIKNKQSQSVSNALITGKNESIVLGVDYDGNDEGVSMSANTGLPKVILLPHQHTLFCERKQRVCTAVGKCQELEVLKLTGNLNDYTSWVWFRSTTNKLPKDQLESRAYTIIADSENKYEYTLGSDDISLFIGVLLRKKGQENASRADGIIGPVLPGPPRLLDFEIHGDLYVGGYAKAEGKYIGGFEGPSEYWWMRVTADGKRVQINEPMPIPPNASDPSKDPRFYKITPEDVGCTLKSKCRPTRNDNLQGEIFTSKSSGKILKAKAKSTTNIA